MTGRVLVTGAGGFVGRALVPALLAQGYAVTATTRSRINAPWADQVRVIVVDDLNAETDWTDALKDATAVIHLAARVHVMNDTATDPLAEFRATNVDGTRHLAEQARDAGANRFVFLSSIKVNGEATQETPFRATDVANPQDPYGLSKAEAEQALFDISQNGGPDVIVIRPPLVYGPGVKGNFLKLMRAVQKGTPLPLGNVHNRRSLVGVGNLADLLVHCVVAKQAANRVFLVRDGEDVSTTDLIRKIGIALGKSARLWPVPSILIRMLGTILGKGAAMDRLLGDLRIDDAETRKALNWTPPFTLQQGLAEIRISDPE